LYIKAEIVAVWSVIGERKPLFGCSKMGMKQPYDWPHQRTKKSG
jgi:hypothetical protein